MIYKIVRLFVNALTADAEHYLFNRDNPTQPIQRELSQKQKRFSKPFFAFLESILNLNIFKKRITLIADVFPKARAGKNVVK